MTEEQILDDWFNRDFNTNRLPTVVYSESDFNFIKANAPMRRIYEGKEFYCVFGDWQKITPNKLEQEK